MIPAGFMAKRDVARPEWIAAPSEFQGRVSEWKDEQGFGFVTPNGGGDRVFLHIKSITSRRRPTLGELVRYRLAKDERGRARAEAVSYVSAREHAPERRGVRTSFLLFAIAYVALATAIHSSSPLHLVTPGAYLLLSVIAYIAYAVDKSAARKGRWRVKESSLQLLALLGGWPGALFAQELLRHKSTKASFRAGFWAMVALNVGACAWLATSAGARFAGTLMLAWD